MSEATIPESDSGWPNNYFNYFTETEEHFQHVRGTALFLLSPLDWALIENWKNAGIPLEAVLKGIDDAFEKWRGRKQKRRLVNSVAYCTQAVMEAAQRAPSSQRRGTMATQSPFAPEELRSYLTRAAESIKQNPAQAFQSISSSLENLSREAESYLDRLEELESRLTALEEKLVATVRMLQSDRELYALRQKLNRELKPYRGKMTADQLSMLESRYLATALLERAHLPRLSLFYLH
ncbi:MAG: hypothetical protein JO210_20095 [Acidobacteriaceae bacterium]|nr:hypothetical protein [Acidobacteriaceae bacterium]